MTEPTLKMALPASASAPVLRPPAARGPMVWVRRNLLSSPASILITVALGLLLPWLAYRLVDWAILRAVWTVVGTDVAGTAACRAAAAGACWAVIAEKHRFILFGLYPYAEQWRPATAVALFVILYLVSADRRTWRRSLAVLWLATLVAIAVLMWGGIAGLPYVAEDQWGGLPVTLILATFGLALAFPLGVAVALGRRASDNVVLRTLCLLYVELIRAIPLVSVLFMASVLFPLFLPEGITISKLLRALAAIALFAAAYISETVRAGIQSLPAGQTEGAKALGLTDWQATRLIILPQAIRAVIPPLVNTFIGFFKSTSLVTIIGIFDLLTAGNRAVTDPAWQGYGTEVYLFVGLIYFAFCFAMASYSRVLERRLAQGHQA